MADDEKKEPDGGWIKNLKKRFSGMVGEQRKKSNKYGNSGRTQSQPGGAYADAAEELEKEEKGGDR